MRRPAMLVRFPSWRAPRRSWPPILPEAVTDYPELADDDDGRAEATRLEELRILATERHAEARLIAGATDGLVVDLASWPKSTRCASVCRAS